MQHPIPKSYIFFIHSDVIYGPTSKLMCLSPWVCAGCVQSVVLENRNNTVFKMEMGIRLQVVLEFIIF